MHQIAFHIGSLPVHWYGVMAALGFLAAVLVMQLNKKYAEMSSDQVSDLMLYTMISGVVGARLFYIVQFWEKDFAGKPFWQLFRIDQGGLVFYGGFLLALATITFYAWKKQLSILRVYDVCTPSLAIGHALGRIGCFLNGCCFGKTCDNGLGVVYPHGTTPSISYPDYSTPEFITQNDKFVTLYKSLPLHPIQLYETAGNVIIFIILMFCLRHKFKAGQIGAIYLILYAILRFIDEFFRGDHKDFIMNLTPAQSLGVILIPAGIMMFIYLQKKGTGETPADGTKQ